MRFWDASAVVPLLTAQATSGAALRLWREDAARVVWWVTPVECASALARLLRERDIDRGASAEAMQRLRALAAAWLEIEPSSAVRDIAVRLVATHPLRAVDALQLAAAVFCRDESGSPVPVVSFDTRLLAAARAENLPTFSDGEAA